MKITGVLAASLFLAATCHASATVLYSPTPIGSSPRTSDYGATTEGGFRTFDSFTLSSSASIEKVSWRGFWADFNSPTPAAAPSPDVLTWEIAFYADNAGTPGGQLAISIFSAATVTSQAQGFGVLSVSNNTYNISYYDYSVDLPAPVPVLAGTQYWVSILSRSDIFNPAFALLAATGGDDVSYQQTLGPGLSVTAGNFVARDRAITLEGELPDAVPLPGALPLFAGGFGLLALAARRRWRAAS